MALQLHVIEIAFTYKQVGVMGDAKKLIRPGSIPRKSDGFVVDGDPQAMGQRLLRMHYRKSLHRDGARFYRRMSLVGYKFNRKFIQHGGPGIKKIYRLLQLFFTPRRANNG